MYHPNYALFFDNHTPFDIPGVGSFFDAEAFTDQLKRCGVDFLGFHARCNQGFAYYDTGIGIRHPSLRRDLFGEIAECCRRKGIRLTAYLNGGLSQEETLRHREWGTLGFDGHELGKERVTPFVRSMCYNSPYREHLKAMIREIAEHYPVDGFFIDCMIAYGCTCPTCVKLMREQGFDPAKEDDVREFSYRSSLKLCGEIASLVRSLLPDPLLYFNSTGWEDRRDCDTYFECECLPTSPIWGYEFLPVMAHYLRTIRPGTPVLNMTGRFLDWGEFGTLRPAESLKFDLLYGLANGMRPNIGGHFHPRGDLDLPVFDRIYEVYSDLQKREEWFSGAEPNTEIAIVYSGKELEMASSPEIRGLVRMLEELKYQYDIVLPEPLKKRYRVLLVPDTVLPSPEACRIVRNHMEEGGTAFFCGANGARLFGDLCGVRWIGGSGFEPAYFRMKQNLKRSPELPELPLSVCSPVEKVEASPETEALAVVVKPFCNRGWDGVRAICYTPPDAETELPFVVCKKDTAYCAGNLFTGYFETGASHLRALFREMMSHLLPVPLVTVENLPSFARVFRTEQENRTVIHVLCYAPEQRGKTVIVEEGAGVLNGKIGVRLEDGNIVDRVLLVPSGEKLVFGIADGMLSVSLPPFAGNLMLALEYRKEKNC